MEGLMNSFIIENEVNIRLGFFFGIFLLIAAWELIWPRRVLTSKKTVRWYSNLGIVFLNSLILRWLFPVMAVTMAYLAQERGWGLLNMLSLPLGIELIISLISLDLVIYFQHRMFHRVPLFWRLHSMHHTDLDLDVTSGARFHPVEIILSMLIKIAVVILLGPTGLAVIIFETLLNTTAMFNHGNILIPKRIDQTLRWLIVTPDMHRVHHSIIPRETNSNFGFNLTWWDRIFGSYKHQPVKGHHDMTIGLEQFRDPKYLHLHWLVILPLLKRKSR